MLPSVWYGDFVVLAPTCIWPTRRTKAARVEIKRRSVRTPQDPNGSHDHNTEEGEIVSIAV